MTQEIKTQKIEKKIYILSSVSSETPEVALVKLVPEDMHALDFEPGMFIMISGLDAQTGKTYVARAFSVASDPAAQEMELFVVKVHDNHTTHFLESKSGDKYLIVGPHGQFRFKPETDKKVVFIAGGTGLAPFMSMLRYINRLRTGTDVALLYSVKYPDEIIKKDELAGFESSIGAKIVITVTRPDEGSDAAPWDGEKGHVDANMIKRHIADYADRIFYVCGPLGFVKAVSEAISSLGVEKGRIKADVWG